jgi:ribosomal protein S18 acetylase RimI-like enzyme
MHIRSYNHEIDEAEALLIFDRNFPISHSFLGKSEQTEARQHLELLLRHSDVFLAEIEGKVIGFITVDDEGYIAALYIDGPHAGRGVGSALLQAAQDLHDRLGLHVFAKNVSALHFYKAQGFTVVGEDRQIDSLGRRHDRLEMERHSYQSLIAS